MSDAGRLERRLREIAALRCGNLERDIEEPWRVVRPFEPGERVEHAGVDPVIAWLQLALREMAELYLSFCEGEGQAPTRHLHVYEAEARSAAAAYAEAWRARMTAEANVEIAFAALEERVAELARLATEDAARGQVARERVLFKPGYAPPPRSKGVAEKIFVALLAAAGAAAIIYAVLL